MSFTAKRPLGLAGAYQAEHLNLMPDRPSSLPTASSAPTDAYERSAQTYPVLSEAMTDRIARFGEAELVADGALLFERGERSVDFFLVRSGAVGILDHGADSSTTTVHRQVPNQFTGELDEPL